MEGGMVYIPQFKHEHFESVLKSGSNSKKSDWERLVGTPQQNRVAERMNRTLMDKVRCLFIQSGLPKTFWAEATCTAAYLINRLFLISTTKTRKLERERKIVLLGVPEGVKERDKSVEELQVEVELQRLNNHTPEEDQIDQEDGDDEDVGDHETDQTPDLRDYQLARDREQRTRTKPLRFQDESNMAAYAFAATEEEDTHEPLTYQEAVACEDNYKWKAAMKEEMDSLAMWIRRVMHQEFDMKGAREAKKILGIEIVRDRSRKILRVSQSGYVSKILNNFRIDDGKSVKMSLGFVDSDYAKDPDKGRSITGYAFCTGMCCKLKVQRYNMVAPFTPEAEYLDLTEAVKGGLRSKDVIPVHLSLDTGVTLEDMAGFTYAARFEELNLSPGLLKGLYVNMKFHRPSEIQSRSLPVILTPPYKNIMAQAHNGSGKTTCLVMAMLSRADPNLHFPQALCLCPTSESAIQKQTSILIYARGIPSSFIALD
ncbi:retrovirus-related pol polyprotein from transposon TNT 1-94 [Tanacetum coccineum]|uniref:Retrovirus-related pol polyprotein from transposon TNT 1-94 n=1 Tax=Tanacetum coccineum TaxID=301880 RepID=A0ABQ5ATH4_9ASTR